MNLKNWKDKAQEQEKERVGDIYAECEKRGCDPSFLKAFDTRIWLYPEKQAQAFLDSFDNPVTDRNKLKERIRQFIIYLEVLILKRPDYEQRGRWEEALKLLNNSLNS